MNTYNQILPLFSSLDAMQREALMRDLGRIHKQIISPDPPVRPYVETMNSIIGEDITSQSRSRRLTDARMIVAYVMHSDGYHLHAIGRTLNRNHATACHYMDRMESALKYKEVYYDVIELYDEYKRTLK